MTRLPSGGKQLRSGTPRVAHIHHGRCKSLTHSGLTRWWSLSEAQLSSLIPKSCAHVRPDDQGVVTIEVGVLGME